MYKKSIWSNDARFGLECVRKKRGAKLKKMQKITKSRALFLSLNEKWSSSFLLLCTTTLELCIYMSRVDADSESFWDKCDFLKIGKKSATCGAPHRCSNCVALYGISHVLSGARDLLIRSTLWRSHGLTCTISKMTRFRSVSTPNFTFWLVFGNS